MWNALIIGADIGQMKGETMNKKEAVTQLEIMATNATGRLGSAKSEEEKALLSKEIEALNMGINAIKRSQDGRE